MAGEVRGLNSQDIFRLAQDYAQHPPDEGTLVAVGAQLQEIPANDANRGAIEQAFANLAQAYERLYAAPEEAESDGDVRPPDPQVEEQLIADEATAALNGGYVLLNPQRNGGLTARQVFEIAIETLRNQQRLGGGTVEPQRTLEPPPVQLAPVIAPVVQVAQTVPAAPVMVTQAVQTVQPAQITSAAPVSVPVASPSLFDQIWGFFVQFFDWVASILCCMQSSSSRSSPSEPASAPVQGSAAQQQPPPAQQGALQQPPPQGPVAQQQQPPIQTGALPQQAEQPLPQAPVAQQQQQLPAQEEILQQQAGQPLPQEPVVQQQPPAQEGVLQQEMPIIFTAEEAQLTPNQWQGRLNLDEAPGGVAVAPYCALEFIVQFWDYLSDLDSDVQIAELIDGSLREGARKGSLPTPDDADLLFHFPRIDSVEMTFSGPTNRDKVAQIDLHARRNPRQMTAVNLSRQGEEHVLLIDARNRSQVLYYHYNLQTKPTTLQRFDKMNLFIDHLNQRIPNEDGNPWAWDVFTVD